MPPPREHLQGGPVCIIFVATGPQLSSPCCRSVFLKKSDLLTSFLWYHATAAGRGGGADGDGAAAAAAAVAFGA